MSRTTTRSRVASELETNTPAPSLPSTTEAVSASRDGPSVRSDALDWMATPTERPSLPGWVGPSTVSSMVRSELAAKAAQPWSSVTTLRRTTTAARAWSSLSNWALIPRPAPPVGDQGCTFRTTLSSTVKVEPRALTPKTEPSSTREPRRVRSVPSPSLRAVSTPMATALAPPSWVSRIWVPSMSTWEPRTSTPFWLLWSMSESVMVTSLASPPLWATRTPPAPLPVTCTRSMVTPVAPKTPIPGATS